MSYGESERGRLEAELKFTTHLKKAVANGKLIPVKHKAGDWLHLLTEAEIEELTAIIEQCPEDLSAGDEIFTLVMNLSLLESGKTLIIDPVEELEILVGVFILMLRLERLRRQGYIELPKTLSLSEDDCQFRFTQKGLQMAEQVKSILG